MEILKSKNTAIWMFLFHNIKPFSNDSKIFENILVSRNHFDVIIIVITRFFEITAKKDSAKGIQNLNYKNRKKTEFETGKAFNREF